MKRDESRSPACGTITAQTPREQVTKPRRSPSEGRVRLPRFTGITRESLPRVVESAPARQAGGRKFEPCIAHPGNPALSSGISALSRQVARSTPLAVRACPSMTSVIVRSVAAPLAHDWPMWAAASGSTSAAWAVHMTTSPDPACRDDVEMTAVPSVRTRQLFRELLTFDISATSTMCFWPPGSIPGSCRARRLRNSNVPGWRSTTPAWTGRPRVM